MSARILIAPFVIALAACAAPRDHFYTLAVAPPAGAGAPGSAFGTASGSAPGSASAASDTLTPVTLAVHVPPELDRAEMIVHTSSDQVLVLEHERWLGLPSDQIAATLGLDLEARRPEWWIGGAPPGAKATIRISVDIAQMSVTSDRRALLEARWRVRQPGGGNEAVGSLLLAEPLAMGPATEHAAIAAAFSRDVAALADRLVEAMTPTPAGAAAGAGTGAATITGAPTGTGAAGTGATSTGAPTGTGAAGTGAATGTGAAAGAAAATDPASAVRR